MGSRFDGSVIAPALCAAVFVGLFLGQCSCQAVPQIVQLGGDAGWTDTANANYTLFMSTVPFKAGDTLRKPPHASLASSLFNPLSAQCVPSLSLMASTQV